MGAAGDATGGDVAEVGVEAENRAAVEAAVRAEAEETAELRPDPHSQREPPQPQ